MGGNRDDKDLILDIKMEGPDWDVLVKDLYGVSIGRSCSMYT